LKKLAFLGGAAGLGLLVLLATQRSQAADHLDSPTLIATPMADINDVFAWMEGSNLNLALSISPDDVDPRAFGPDVQYVFHIHSKPMVGVGEPGFGRETRVLCTFASDTSAQCWVAEGDTVKDHIAGDPSNPGGITSQSGKVRLFAGRRSDPLAFNLQGFRKATGLIRDRVGAAPALVYDAAGCPTNITLNEALSYFRALGEEVPGQPPCAPTGRDCFAMKNVKIILVQLDKGLVNSGQNTAVGVWASTHAPT